MSDIQKQYKREDLEIMELELKQSNFRLMIHYSFILILLSYLHSIGLTEIILLHVKNLDLHQNQPITNHIVKNDFEAPGEMPKELAAFDEVEFLKSYQCDPAHEYELNIIKDSPVLVHIKNFLQDGEADYLKKISFDLLKPSRVFGGKAKKSESRTSLSAFLSSFKEDPVYQCIHKRTETLTRIPQSHYEPMQVVRYQKGQFYKPHHDYFNPEQEGAEKVLAHGGNRKATIFVYLSTIPEEMGGHTDFPKLNITVPSVKNDATFWYNMFSDGTLDDRTLHAGTPPKGDIEKFGLNIWIREQPFV